MRKIFIFILVVLAAAVSCGRKGAHHLVIIHTNDTHSHFEPVRSGAEAGLGGVIERAAYIDSVMAAEGKGNVLLLHAGDFSQGTSYFTVLDGNLEIETLNALGYDAACLGNHEFDNGLEDLGRRLENVKCPIVCANYDFTPFKAGEFIKPYTIVEKAGLRIGIFGILTNLESVVDKSNPNAPALLKLDDFQTANYWASLLKEQEGCDLVIALTHIGLSVEKQNITDSVLVQNCRNIDLVVGGHSHTFLDNIKYVADLDGKEIPIVQDGCWGLNMGEITLDLD